MVLEWESAGVPGARWRALPELAALNHEGDVAQLGERRPCTAEVVGSSPIISTRIDEMHPASPLEARGRFPLFDNLVLSGSGMHGLQAARREGRLRPR